jgi:hypothetical protein
MIRRLRQGCPAGSRWGTRSARRCAALAIALASVSPLAAEEPAGARGDWWDIPYPRPLDPATIPGDLDFIRVDGNRFVDEAGNVVVFRGLSISDPDKLELDGRWSRAHFEAVASWGADLVRIPVHPIAWRGRGPAAYLELLDQAVRWSSELGLYVMIDWHSIGNLATGLFQHPMYDTTEQETLQFWRTIAARYKGIPAVAFYEIFNEPTGFVGQLGRVSWADWKRFNEEAIGIIYAHDRQVIPLVAGFDWAYDLTPVRLEPIDAEGIGYVSHPYPQKVPPPWEPKWERDFGFVADRYPLFVTEFGFKGGEEPGAHLPVVGDESYGRSILDFLDARGASWAAWCFDPDWGPQLIEDWAYTPTRSGAFFKRAMSAPRSAKPAAGGR